MEAQGNGYANGKHLPIIGNGFPLIHRASFADDFVFGAASAAFQACQKGKIGITNVVNWMEPYTDSKADIDATERALDFMLGW
ncbi:hypothetical protein RHMOL_Rhmol11G0210600 [Rhododendron molle]|uniref:Uncharacterized protein n=1 Tax=Rhododendron molle TaxID=49168 RepID=A0ACC0LUS3_RHOML|nr:hypothetical protein RHMOL_Rhmol11G0210600 [Rhododendron molle]